ncbi:hypothetical protein SynPROS71_00160 [Synechococcus sp. PROS-7-1]|uniref:hypothetical protein n=1 Tax=Synechococcus sp. PROS-7-1 TaxID=1442556 RepID=UPI0016485B58|nr:hypothetical protein [Synechococcus sp. PROS-7-1]QNI83999.1 hypothetical protein SynPROS71_00160 [Synechococcus sp. PROS-7-1]
MARLEQALQLRRLSRSLSICSNDPDVPARRVMKALRGLGAGRPRLLKGLRAGGRVGLDLSSHHPKLRLWSAAAGHPKAGCGDALELLQMLQSTEAWHQAGETLRREAANRRLQLWNHRGRLKHADAVLAHLRQHPQAPLFFWHHYDRRGLLPRSWMAVFQGLKAAGWCVVVSSSELAAEALDALQHQGIPVLLRNNIGLCLGAYRDFCCLLNESSDLTRARATLVLANDSTLPVGGANAFLRTLSLMADEQDPALGQLSGITDSVERDRYHVQSYLLMGNARLIQAPAWEQFWREFPINGSKDDLINQGELGLSQALLQAGFTVKARFSLIHMLLDESTTHGELARFEVREPREVNLSLFAWQSLLKQGCPLLKKQVLFNLPLRQTLPLPLSELKPYLGPDDDGLRADLEDLLRSRYLNP